MSTVSSAYPLNEAATAIAKLVNESPRTPRIDEFEAVLRPFVTATPVTPEPWFWVSATGEYQVLTEWERTINVDTPSGSLFAGSGEIKRLVKEGPEYSLIKDSMLLSSKPGFLRKPK